MYTLLWCSEGGSGWGRAKVVVIQNKTIPSTSKKTEYSHRNTPVTTFRVIGKNRMQALCFCTYSSRVVVETHVVGVCTLMNALLTIRR